jgi:hypothetical protein
VLEAAVAGVPDHYLGEEIAAFVVLKPGAPCDARDLLRFCAGELGHFKTPSTVHLVDRLPRGGTGKVQRHRLAELAARRPANVVVAADEPASAPAGAPGSRPDGQRALVEEVLVAAWAEVLGRGQVHGDDDFFALGGHSLDAGRIVARVRDALNVELPVGVLFDAPTPARLAAHIAGCRTDHGGPGGPGGPARPAAGPMSA